MALVDYMNPVRVFRKYIRTPVEAFLSQQFLSYRKKTNEGINSVKELIYKASVIAVFSSAILWTSIFMYVAFYYTYMPNVAHVRPVHLQFKSCDENLGVCSFPTAHVQLTKRNHMLMSAQPYRIHLILDMPETPLNKELGMFMVCTHMRGKDGVLVSTSCRSTMLRYRSRLHQLLRTIVLAPLLLSGCNEEKQQLQVELFSDFQDNPNLPVTDAYVELQSRHAQVYACELHIEAHFSGLRYFMFNWPKLSAAIGISTNLFFVSLIFILSWYHLQDGLPDFIKPKFGSEPSIVDETETEAVGKIKLEKSESAFFDDIIFEDLPLVDTKTEERGKMKEEEQEAKELITE